MKQENGLSWVVAIVVAAAILIVFGSAISQVASVFVGVASDFLGALIVAVGIPIVLIAIFGGVGLVVYSLRDR